MYIDMNCIACQRLHVEKVKEIIAKCPDKRYGLISVRIDQNT